MLTHPEVYYKQSHTAKQLADYWHAKCYRLFNAHFYEYLDHKAEILLAIDKCESLGILFDEIFQKRKKEYETHSD